MLWDRRFILSKRHQLVLNWATHFLHCFIIFILLFCANITSIFLDILYETYMQYITLLSYIPHHFTDPKFQIFLMLNKSIFITVIYFWAELKFRFELIFTVWISLYLQNCNCILLEKWRKNESFIKIVFISYLYKIFYDFYENFLLDFLTLHLPWCVCYCFFKCIILIEISIFFLLDNIDLLPWYILQKIISCALFHLILTINFLFFLFF